MLASESVSLVISLVMLDALRNPQTNIEADSSVNSSSIAQPLIKEKQSPVNMTSVQINVNVGQSPKQMASARDMQRERSLQLNNSEGGVKHVVQSQEGSINVVQRPRIKIPDGMGEQMDSHVSEGPINENRVNTEGQQP